MQDPYVHREFENPDQFGDHFAQLHFAGCPNCGYAVDVTVPVLRHADVLLSLVYDLLERATNDETRQAIALVRGEYDDRVKLQLLDDADFFELKQLWETLRDRPREADEKKRRTKK